MAVLHTRTLGNALILEVNATPNGSVTSSKGSMAIDSTNGKLYINHDGSTGWFEASPTGSSSSERHDDAGSSAPGSNRITIGAVHLIAGDDKPNTQLQAPKGSMHLNTATARFGVNSTGAQAWSALSRVGDGVTLSRMFTSGDLVSVSAGPPPANTKTIDWDDDVVTVSMALPPSNTKTIAWKTSVVAAAMTLQGGP